jgi:DNA polymerase-1
MKKLYLVDVSSMFFRAFYAVRMLSNSQGMPTNAIYGFLSMSVKLLKDIKPDYMVYCYDQPGPSFRKEIYEDYKANRGETPEELVPQIPYIKKLTELMGIPGIGKENYEADDIIGSLARYGRENKLEVVIVSGDKDFAQLIEDKVQMYDTMKDVQFTVDKVVEKWGVRPDQFIDYLAITGDSSDNIPGVKGIGPKGAQKLLQKFESLDGIYENLGQVRTPSHIKKLEESKSMAYLSKKLVEIVQDLDLVKSLDELRLRPIDSEGLGAVLDELEFNSFKKNLLGSATQSQKASASAQSARKKSLKVETCDLEALDKWLNGKDEVFVWRDARQFFVVKGDDCKVVEGKLHQVGEILAAKDLLWNGFDVKSVWRELGVVKGEVKSDLMLSSYLLKAGAIKSLNEVYQLYTGQSLPEFPSPSDILVAYEQTRDVVLERLKEQKMLPILQTVDLPLVEVLAAMEARGVLLDTETLGKESQTLAKEIASLEKDIKEMAGEEFNVASPKQLSHILFEKMELPKGKKTKTGYSTANDVLEKLVDDYPIVEKVLEFRELSKLKSTYVDALPELVNEHTGRIHTVFNQALTTTGRLSSNHPNLQNIPIRTPRGRKVREAFIVPAKCKMLSADYSQIELRVLAHITNDAGLIAAFNDDRDIHAWTASEVFGVKLEEVTPEQRRRAKAVNFGIAYGQGVYGLAETLKISRKESKEIIENYFEKFSGVKSYMDNIVEKAKDQGYVETLFGRRRYLPELQAKSPMQRSFGERAAINAPIQGTASDLVKMAMLELYEDYPTDMLLQVHDELLFELPEKEIQDHAQKIKEIMENNVKLKVKLKVNVAWGDNWSEAH